VNVGEFVDRAARYFPNRPAVTWRDRTLSYAEFRRQVVALDAWLRAKGVQRGSRVIVFMENRPEILVAMFAGFRSGGAVVPCNVRLTADELGFIVSDAEPVVVVTDPDHEEVAREAAAGVELLVAGPGFEEVVGRDVSGLAPADVVPSDTAWIFYTSGTTGRPKGAMLPHSVLTFVTVSWLAELTPLNERDVTLHAAPLSHGAGFHALAVTARAAHHVIAPGASFDPEATLRLVGEAGVTNTWMVPTQIVMLTEAAAGRVDLPSLQYVVYGGAPMAPTAITRALECFGPVFVQLYGQGETPMTATVLRRQDHRPELLGSAGRPRLGVDVAVADAEGHILAPGEIGEVVVRGPSVMSGYWRRPEATNETLRGGWLHTGDLGRFSDDGVLWLLDRTKDMIISGGANVYAVEVERVLMEHPDVIDVAVVGLPDELWGEVVTAVVVTRSELDPAALEDHCRRVLAGYKIPRRWVQAESLPRNAYGKVLKRELRERLGRDARATERSR
jgi:long-chain acyl-CoA synthetase